MVNDTRTNADNSYVFTQSSDWHEKLFADVVLLCSLLGFHARARRGIQWDNRAQYVMVRITGDRINEVPCLLGRKRALTRFIKQQIRWRPEVHELSRDQIVYNIALEDNQNFIRADRLVLAGYAIPPREEIANRVQEVDQRIQQATATINVHEALRGTADAYASGWDFLGRDLRTKASLMSVLTIIDESAARRLPLTAQLPSLKDALATQIGLLVQALENGQPFSEWGRYANQVKFISGQIQEVERRSAPLSEEYQQRIRLLDQLSAVIQAGSAVDNRGNRIDTAEEIRDLVDALKKSERRDWYS